MNTKRITYLSELHKIIGNYLYEHGDADIRSIGTHCNRDHSNHLKYSLLVHNFKESDEWKEDRICIDYHNVDIKELEGMINDD